MPVPKMNNPKPKTRQKYTEKALSDALHDVKE